MNTLILSIQMRQIQYKKSKENVVHIGDKAVSPIIATILLVAITVILASTLYLALGGFFSHVGTSTPTVSLSATNTSASSSSLSYSITVGSVSATGINMSNVEIKLIGSGNNIVTITHSPTPTAGQWWTSTNTSVFKSASSGGAATLTSGLTITISLISGVIGLSQIQLIDTGTNGGEMGYASIS